MAKVDPDEVIAELKLDPQVFHWDSNSRRGLEERVSDAIAMQDALVRRKVGAANYAVTTEPTKTCLRAGILYRACAAVLRQVANVIAYAPEHIVDEVADLATIEASIEDYRTQADEFLVPYYTSDDEVPSLVFAIGSTGVAERESDWLTVPTEEFEGKDDEVSYEEYLEDQS